MTARFIVGDTRAVTATLPDGSVELIMSSPPYLALRSYLPADHPMKPFEIGSEATPAEFIDVLLALTAEWRRVLNPRTGSIVIELGDTYAGSGGTGGDYGDGGIREGQPRFDGSKARGDTIANGGDGDNERRGPRTFQGSFRAPIDKRGDAWPRNKSLTGIPERYRLSLMDGVNICTGQPSPAGRWQIRNNITRCSPNPPVGMLGKKWRNGTTDLVVATPDDNRRYWDDVATRVANPRVDAVYGVSKGRAFGNPGAGGDSDNLGKGIVQNPAGAPLLDHWNLLTNRIDRALQLARSGADGYTQEDLFGVTVDKQGRQKETPGGKLIREAWQNGEIDLGDFWPVVAGGYPGAHYAVYPPELCEPFIEAMCPRRVCLTCGEPSRRETSGTDWPTLDTVPRVNDGGIGTHGDRRATSTTTGWTTCGHPGTDGIQLDGYHTGTGWRPGIVLDPFAGTGTTLAVATGHGRDAIGIDLDDRNAELALERVGPLLLIVEHHDTTTAA